MAIDVPLVFDAIEPGESVSDGPAVSLSVSTVPQLPALPELISPNSLGYLAYGHTVELIRDSGLRVQVPLAAKRSVRGDAVRIHTGHGVRVVTYAVLRAGRKPLLPSQAASGDNEVLMTSSVLLFNPAKMPDGTLVFAVVGTATYALLMSPDDTDELDFPATVLEVEAGGTHALTSADVTEYFRMARAVSGPAGQKVQF